MVPKHSPDSFPTTLTFTVQSRAEQLALQHALAMAREVEAMTGAAVPGKVLEVCEAVAVDKGRELTRQTLETIVQEYIDTAEKKGRR